MSHHHEQLSKREGTYLFGIAGSVTGWDYSISVLCTQPTSLTEYGACGIESVQNVTFPLLVGLGTYGLIREGIRHYQTQNTDDKSSHSKG